MTRRKSGERSESLPVSSLTLMKLGEPPLNPANLVFFGSLLVRSRDFQKNFTKSTLGHALQVGTFIFSAKNPLVAMETVKVAKVTIFCCFLRFLSIFKTRKSSNHVSACSLFFPLKHQQCIVTAYFIAHKDANRRPILKSWGQVAMHEIGECIAPPG